MSNQILKSTDTAPVLNRTREVPDEHRLNALLGQLVSDLGAAVNGSLVLTGDKLGLYKALAEHGPLTSSALAERTGTAERYVREWLASQAASGYVEFDPTFDEFSLTPEQVAVFADENSPALMTGGFYSMASVYRDEPKLAEAFRSGGGIEWGDHDSCLFCGVAKFFRPSYEANLVQQWIPSLDGVQEKLERGVRVADVGCGHGLSTLILARAFPNSHFFGYDPHGPSIAEARKLAAQEGLKNVTFEVGTAQDYPGGGFDLVACFDCLHDMGDPVGAAHHIHESLADGGTWLIVEPFAHDDLEDNLNPVGRVYYAYSTAICVPTSLSQEVGAGLGAQAGERRLRDVLQAGGFERIRRAAESPFNLILEARR